MSGLYTEWRWPDTSRSSVMLDINIFWSWRLENDCLDQEREVCTVYSTVQYTVQMMSCRPSAHYSAGSDLKCDASHAGGISSLSSLAAAGQTLTPGYQRRADLHQQNINIWSLSQANGAARSWGECETCPTVIIYTQTNIVPPSRLLILSYYIWSVMMSYCHSNDRLKCVWWRQSNDRSSVMMSLVAQ